MAEDEGRSEKREPQWSDSEAGFIHYEEFVSRVLRERAKSEQGGGSKPAWQRFLESSGGTALITVIIGGLLGAWISGIIQSGAKDREFQQAWLKARGDQALISYKDFLDKQQEIIKRVYERVGTCISSSEDLISLSKPELAKTADYEGEQKERLKKYRVTVQDKFTLSEAEWRNDREALGLLMDYYHPRQVKVVEAWRNVKESVTRYMGCASDWSARNPLSTEIESACKPQKDSVVKSLEQLTASLEENRTYAWEGWENPDRLKAALTLKAGTHVSNPAFWLQ
jgi:hypothetical protein